MADIYKTKEIETNINERGVNLGDVDVTLYTMDKGSSAFKIYLKREVNYGNEKVYDSVNLYTTNMTPRIDIVASDGSTFTNEPVDIVVPESGVIQYVVSDYVIRHAGKMDVYIYLENDKESVQVANFYFYVEDDGVTRRLGKEITGDRLEDVVKNVMSGQLMELLSQDYREQLDKEIKSFLQDNNKDFNLKFEDLTREEKDELMKNLTNQGLADFRIEDNSIPNGKLVDGTIRPNKTAFFTKNKTSNLLDLVTLQKDKTVDVDGKIIDEKGRWLTDYIAVDSQLNEQINFNNGTYRVALYDENKKFITRGGAANTTFYKPNSSTFAKYIRLSGTIDPNILMINKGSSLFPYEKPVSLTEEKLMKKYLPTITQDMTNFFETKASSNLFDASKVTKNKTIETDGTIIDDDVRWLSDYILVDSQKDEQINFPDGAYRIALYDENKKFITRSGATGTNYKPNPSTFAKYIRLSGTQDLNSMTVNKGKYLLDYEEYYPEQTKLKREFVPKPKTEELSIIETKISSNLLDLTTLQKDTSIDTNGSIINETGRWLTGYFQVDSQKNEQINFTKGTYRIALYDENKKFITRGGAADSTSYKPNSSTFAKYVRISGTINPNELMINKGNNLLPYEKPYGKIMKIKEEYLPSINSSTTNNTSSLSQSELAKIEQNIQTYTPSFPKFDFKEISVGYDEVLNMSKDGKRVYGKTGPMVWVSYDECKTKIPVVKDAGNSIQAVRELDDGELLFSTERDTINQTVNGRICKTRGFNKETGTANSYVNILETPSSQSKVTNSWGMSVYKNIVVASEYGLKTSEGARRVWLSKDYGETFKVIFDQMTSVEKIEGAPTWAGDTAHVHSCAFDPYWNRIWVVTGDHPNSAMYYSDDFGDTWTWVDVGDKPVVQHTGIIALPNCVIFGSDRAPNGVYVYYRGQKSDMPVVEPLLLINDNPTITHVFQLPFKRDWDSLTPVYFSGTGAGGMDYKSVCVATVDGKKAFVLHENEIDAKFGGKCQAFIGPTAQGNVLGAFLDKDISGFRLGKAKAPTWTKL